MSDSDRNDNQVQMLVDAIAARLKDRRHARGWSAGELARRAGISKSTLTQLELGRGNPGIETLWALAGALDLPFAALIADENEDIKVVRAGQGVTTYAEGTDYSASLLARLPSASQQGVYHLNIGAGACRQSPPHSPGTTEHLIVSRGALLAGPLGAEVLLGPGDYLRFPGDRAHRYAADNEGPVGALLIMSYA